MNVILGPMEPMWKYIENIIGWEKPLLKKHGAIQIHTYHEMKCVNLIHWLLCHINDQKKIQYFVRNV
jgi:hypothetical protein